MKKIEHLPPQEVNNAEFIVSTLRSEFAQVVDYANGKKKYSQILKIILFGSRAKGIAVSNRISGYVSDYDVLVILNRSELAGSKVWKDAGDRFSVEIPVPVSLIVHTLPQVNDALIKGHYFFKDIYNDGIILYESDKTPLAKPGTLSPEEYRQIARGFFNFWFPRGCVDLKGYNIWLELNEYAKASFELHQAAERFYSCLLLVLTLYKPHTHNLLHFNQLCTNAEPRMNAVFPQDKKKHRSRLYLLNQAYTVSRYDEDFEYQKEDLEWLAERVEVLRDLVKIICKEKIK